MDVTHPLSEFDRLLAHGPYYEKLALHGALAGGLVSLFAGKPEARGNLGHAAAYAVAGTGLAIGGAFLLFQFGKFVSNRSHEAVAEAHSDAQAARAAGAYLAGASQACPPGSHVEYWGYPPSAFCIPDSLQPG